MIIFIDSEGNICIFEKREDAEVWFETIDIMEEEYEFMDEYGQIIRAEIVNPPGYFSTGAFKLLPTGEFDKRKLLSAIEKTHDLLHSTKNIRTLNELKTYLSRTLSDLTDE